MKSKENSNINIDIKNPSKNKKNNTIDFRSLCSMNDSNMSAIDKKIKTKYTSALTYINNLTDKKITIPTSSSIKKHKIQKLKNEMLSSLINNIHSTKYKNNTDKNTLNGNHNRNNSINFQEMKGDYFSKKMKNILTSSEKSIDSNSKKNRSTISNLYNNKSINEKTKQKIEQIISIFNPHIIMSDPKENKTNKQKRKRKNQYQMFDDTSPTYKFKQLRSRKRDERIISDGVVLGQSNDYNELLSDRYVSKVNTHVDFYDTFLGINTKKSASCQRIIHMTKVIKSELQGKNNLNMDFDQFKLNNDDNLNKDLFPMTHERKIKNKLIDFRHFEIFPDINRRNKKEELLAAYAENNLKIITEIKGDLKNDENKFVDQSKKMLKDDLKGLNIKFDEKKAEPKIDVKEEINIDDLLD